MAFTRTIAPAASAERVADGTGAPIDVGNFSALRLVLSASALVGADPTLLVLVETSEDGLTWSQAGAFAERSEPGEQRLTVGGCSRFARVRWELSGDSATFSIAGTAVQAFAKPQDLYRLALPEAALEDIPEGTRAEALISSGDDLWGRFNGRYVGPLTSWDDDLTKHTCAVAACQLLTTRGLGSDGGDWPIFKDLRDQAYAWAEKVGAGKLTPGIIGAPATSSTRQTAFMYSETPRGRLF